jgi:hypothetical protein
MIEVRAISFLIVSGALATTTLSLGCKKLLDSTKDDSRDAAASGAATAASTAAAAAATPADTALAVASSVAVTAKNAPTGAKKALATPSSTTDRFPRNRLKDGPCPAGFVEQPGAEEHSSCARSCKTDTDCHAHTCVDSDVGNGKVCSNEAATAKPTAAIANLPKCKGEERLWAANEKSTPFCATGEPTCSSDKDCKGKGTCFEGMMIEEDGHPALSHNGTPMGTKFCKAK